MSCNGLTLAHCVGRVAKVSHHNAPNIPLVALLTNINWLRGQKVSFIFLL
jgi:hypothetical protein